MADNLSNEFISESFQRLLQIAPSDNKSIVDGTGSAVQLNVQGITGSFSGSFYGDGSSITGVTAEWDGTHIGKGEITGSFSVSGSIDFFDTDCGFF